jgi:DNA modification methylase
MSSKNNITYYGVDPSTKTFVGLKNLIGDLHDIFLGNAIITQIGSEEYIPPEPIDMAFTSPPYFDTEKYSNEDTQSYIKYANYNSWINSFLGATFNNCYKALKNDGLMIINIANTARYRNLENDAINIADKVGFKLIDKNYLILSQVSKKTGYKTEPIYIFNKK